MNNVWKIGSRWGNISLIGIFRRSGYVFSGCKLAKNMEKVGPGDYIAIAKGKTIVSVAIALNKAEDINDLRADGKIRLRGENINLVREPGTCFGIRVKIVDLPNEKWIKFGDIRGFVQIYDKAKDVIKCFQESNNTSRFNIKSSVCRIGKSERNDGKGSIIGAGVYYNIPVYQREYSWGYDEIYRFISDIFKGFWGSEEQKCITRDPMFIGTMQLSYKKYISMDEAEQDVIDGQQRLSTIMCLLKFLQLRYPANENVRKISIDWLETKVNNGKEDELLRRMQGMTSLEEIDASNKWENRYIQNLCNICNCFDEQVNDENGKVSPIFEKNIDSFIDYLLEDVYVVVIETAAGLSKTIQIFNTINTAGLDLNGSDLFKVRFYEYLHDRQGEGEEAFTKIGDFYKTVKEKNSEWRKTHNYDIISVNSVLSVYKYWLISRHGLRNTLYTKSTDAFFNELFDSVLGVQEHEEFKKLNDFRMTLNDLGRIVDVICMWEESKCRSSDEFITYKLIQQSRYSRYLNIVYLILLSNESMYHDIRLNQVYEVLSKLCRIFFCWSLEFSRVVNEISTLMNGSNGIYNMMKDYQSNRDSVINTLDAFIKKKKSKEFNEQHIGKAIAGNRTWKNLVCFLSAYLDEVDKKYPIGQIQEHLSCEYDIEHIHANANNDEAKGISYALQNSIGNLMLLELDINRSIGCLRFEEKKGRSTGKSYKDSRLATVEKIIKENKQWELNEINARRNLEIERISTFLFG